MRPTPNTTSIACRWWNGGSCSFSPPPSPSPLPSGCSLATARIEVFRALDAALKSERYDVVHMHVPRTAILLLATNLRRRRSMAGSVYALHNSFFNLRPLGHALLIPADWMAPWGGAKYVSRVEFHTLGCESPASGSVVSTGGTKPRVVEANGLCSCGKTSTRRKSRNGAPPAAMFRRKHPTRCTGAYRGRLILRSHRPAERGVLLRPSPPIDISWGTDLGPLLCHPLSGDSLGSGVGCSWLRCRGSVIPPGKWRLRPAISRRC